MTNGNPLAIKFEESFREALYNSSEKSAMALVEAVAKGVEQGVGRLLEVK